MSDRNRDIINHLNIENKIFKAENSQLKAMKRSRGAISDSEVDSVIVEVSHDLRRLKKASHEESMRCKKKMKMAVCALVVSWFIFLVMFIVC